MRPAVAYVSSGCLALLFTINIASSSVCGKWKTDRTDRCRLDVCCVTLNTKTPLDVLQEILKKTTNGARHRYQKNATLIILCTVLQIPRITRELLQTDNREEKKPSFVVQRSHTVRNVHRVPMEGLAECGLVTAYMRITHAPEQCHQRPRGGSLLHWRENDIIFIVNLLNVWRDVLILAGRYVL